jgi:hypothetical protein
MAPLLEDPRIRQTWNQISHNAESATETAAAGIWTFQHTYINPCFASVVSGLESCTTRCIGDRDERVRRLRERDRTIGRAELSFDFYDDWDEEGDAGGGRLLGGWGNDELDRLLAGSGSHRGTNDGSVNQPPRRKRGMSYGTRNRRQSLDRDPTVIPNTNALGFLGRLPFKLGGTLRYKPSAADLQEHPGALRSEIRDEEEGQPLISDDQDEGNAHKIKGHTRTRSSTTSSGETTDSFRSRGDLFASDGEDDAVPLSDEFAMVLERRMAGPGNDDHSSGKTRNSRGKRPTGSRTISRISSGTTQASQTRPTLGGQRSSSAVSVPQSLGFSSPDRVETPTLMDLHQEEELIRIEEDAEVERKRQAATRLATERKLIGESFEAEDSLSEAKQQPDDKKSFNVPFDDAETSNEVLDGCVADQTSTMKEIAPGERGKYEFVPARLPNFR